MDNRSALPDQMEAELARKRAEFAPQREAAERMDRIVGWMALAGCGVFVVAAVAFMAWVLGGAG